MTNDISIPDQIAALSPERVEWLKTRATALAKGVFRAVGMPSERGSMRLGAEFARIHGLNMGEKWIADDAILAVLVKLEKRGYKCAPGLGEAR